jgi:hypothetical protein
MLKAREMEIETAVRQREREAEIERLVMKRMAIEKVR